MSYTNPIAGFSVSQWSCKKDQFEKFLERQIPQTVAAVFRERVKEAPADVEKFVFIRNSETKREQDMLIKRVSYVLTLPRSERDEFLDINRPSFYIEVNSPQEGWVGRITKTQVEPETISFSFYQVLEKVVETFKKWVSKCFKFISEVCKKLRGAYGH